MVEENTAKKEESAPNEPKTECEADNEQRTLNEIDGIDPVPSSVPEKISPATPLPPKMEFPKMESKFDWEDQIRGCDRGNQFEARLLSVLYHAPNPDLHTQFKALYPETNYHGYSIVQNLNEVAIYRQALEKAYDQLLKLRTDGLGTHGDGHAKATLFWKLLTDLFMPFDHSTFQDAIIRIFTGCIDHIRYRLQEAFKPIYNVLTATVEFPGKNKDDANIEPPLGLKKRQKQLLLRAFFPDFIQAWDDFQEFDWVAEYTAFYIACLKAFQEIRKTNPEVKTVE